MPFFSRPSGPAPLTAADLQDLHAAVEAVRVDLSAHRAVTEAQGRVLATMPADTLRHFENEVSVIANKLALAALKRAREEVVNGIVKWGTRVILGSVGAYIVSQWSALLGALHK